ncbi:MULTISPECIES: DUF2878 domain-containing protein [unclassified Pseudomonas]|uniref:DUF2878 domain-containing protein n=1 Tax=unclassified Pseudomonas TaxID=196821 RepID=UPI0021C818F5|nr:MULTISPECIES: DUF2878 domain-containing protein [unclassified Pseudomonas]MCU1732321.1 DUF2878 domain-containing protein [Pseudomonas sp. 20P_3.2_Bac4]MCU1746666.1 DUF2878 domain-containing protein [Pseudomonas sp. 20P_3.2_Bac5]
MSRAWLLGNALWLQAGWWGCVLGAQRPWLLLPVLIGLLIHVRYCDNPKAELAALLRVGLAGCLLDSGLGAAGVFAFDQTPLPLWLALLWLVLASGMRHSLAWAAHPLGWGALLGLLGAPPAYLAGARLAGIELPLGNLNTALLLAPLWALWLPLCLRLAAWR